MRFKRNFHIAKRCRLDAINRQIKMYPKQFATPKYLLFIKQMLEAGWLVKIYTVRASKYVFIVKGEDIFKVRFSNHKPIYDKEISSDCDYYVGVSHTQCSTTDDIIKRIIQPNEKRE